MKKRACLCFSGQPRNVQKGFEHINKNILEANSNYEFDTFVHMWFDKESSNNGYTTAKGDSVVANKENVVETIYNLYDPKKMLLEKQREFDEKDYNDRKSQYIVPKFSLSKNYSMMKVAELKRSYEQEKNFVYDRVVSVRFDLGVQSAIIFDLLDQDSIQMSTHGVWMGEGVDVTHGVMSSNDFDLYANFYNYIDICYRDFGVEFCDERLMHKYLDLKNIKYNRNSMLNNYILLRN